MSCESALNLDQWKPFSENYKPMRVWLWLVYKFTENCQIYLLFSEFIQTKKRYPTSLDKIRIPTMILLVNLTLKELAPCWMSHICRCAYNYKECMIFLISSEIKVCTCSLGKEKPLYNPHLHYVLKLNNRNTRTRFKTSSTLTRKTTEWYHWGRYETLLVNFKHISRSTVLTLDFKHVMPYILLLTLSWRRPSSYRNQSISI